MSQIDISQWKEFKVGKLFDFYRGKEAAPKRVPEGNIPMINETQENNGVAKQADSEHVFPGNSITVSVNYASTVFYQPKDFCASVNIIILHNDYLNDARGKFIAAMLSKYNQRFSYTNKISQQKLKEIKLPLPVDSNGNPDWQYMDTYIAKLTTLAHENVSSLKKAKAKPAKLNIDQWGEFKISDWFDIRPSKYTKENGKALKNAELFDGGNNPVIVNSNTNNGIGGYTSKPLTEQGNVITYSDTTDGASTIFYQAKPFVGYSHVKVMLPKLKLSQATMIYLTSIIISAIKNQKYDFSYKLTTDKMLNTIIKLPIDAKGEPDWEYMDNQVRHLAALSNLTITSLNPVELPIFVGEWQEFSVNKVFNVFTGAQVPRRYLINGSQERISVTNENNGVISKFDENELLKSSNARILTNFVSINFFGYAFYHKNKASLEMKVHAIQRKDDVSFSENQGLYIASLLNSQYAGKYGYGNQLSSSTLKNKVIKLPVDLQGDPDWQYMDRYISWIKQYSKNKLTLIQ